MMRGKRHDKIVQLHQKEISREGDGRGKKFLYPEWMTEGVEPCFRYDPFFEHSLSLMAIAILKHFWPMNLKYSTGP